MKTFILIWLTALLGLAVQTEAQTVSNVRAAQRSGTKLVDVYYDLTGASGQATVQVAVSDNGGTSYAVPVVSLSGDVGGGVNAGLNKHVIWNAGTDWNGKFSQAIKVRITAKNILPSPDGFVLIPEGVFQMGDPFNEGDTSERPVHTVYISPFFIGKYEVTKALWDEVKSWGESNGYSDLPSGGGKAANHPVHTVSWLSAVKWCNARSEKEGLLPSYRISDAVYRNGSIEPQCDWTANGYRLPTEAEWEKAARGGVSGKRFPWGDSILPSDANYNTGIGGSPGQPAFRGDLPYTSPVGTFPANAYNIHDSIGNVWEWCWDYMSDSYYTLSNFYDPNGPMTGGSRVYRGGSWYAEPWASRTSFRKVYIQLLPGHSFGDRGFRLARNASL